LTAIYDATAWYWDSFIHVFVYGRAYGKLLERLRNDGWYDAPVERVLDCGVGAGVFSQGFIATFGRQRRAYGIDLSRRLLERAAMRLGRRGTRVHLLRADARALPLKDRVIDALICGLVLDHLADPSAALGELARVCRAGAPVVIVTTRQHAPDLPFRLVFRYRRPRPAYIEHAMRAVGFHDIRRYALTGLARPFGIAFAGRAPIFTQSGA
jgi:ubiquinone/menaquinone biosynthesis C-methylase UbiE